MLTLMQVLPIQTSLLEPRSPLADLLTRKGDVKGGDIVVLSSKALATVEGSLINLQNMSSSKNARELSEKTGRSPEFCEAVLQETERMHGHVRGTCPGAALTELRPEGLATGTILVANAGLDQSNAPEGYAIGWPKDPVDSLTELRRAIESSFSSQPSSPSLALLLTDSSCRPRRLGVTAFAMVASGVDPLVSQKGKKDLFGKELRITTEAIGDQLATAGNFLMGNAGQSIPAVIIRDHGLTLSDWEGWVPGIEPEEDLFRGIF